MKANSETNKFYYRKTQINLNLVENNAYSDNLGMTAELVLLSVKKLQTSLLSNPVISLSITIKPKQ